MPFGASRLTDETATEDVIMGPGVPTVMIANMPASCVGDTVTGPAIVGFVAMGSRKVIIEGRPATRITSKVMGVNPDVGIAATSAIATGVTYILIP